VAAEFKGEIKLDVRDSTPDWNAYLAPRAPEGAPNVLIVLYDDTGLAAWSPYGGRIDMPTMDRLAANGLTYTQWHTTSVCSPTRSTFLTGRNHHQNGYATISESSTGFPGYNGHIPRENASIATVLRSAGWSTFWVGKNHNVPVDSISSGSSREEWPLGQGFDRFYGFIGGETNNWYPDLAVDNHYIDQPYQPEDGYHLSKDLADQAIRMIRDSKQCEPKKPWYMWLCPGANHAPHHCPPEYIEKYQGQFDDGYEAYREWVLARMIERGIMPEGTELTEMNPMTPGTFAEDDQVRPWSELNDDEKRLFARMAEVYAGFSEYTDAQIGRVIDYLEESGQLDNTIIMYCADNGASGEGSPNGLVNENLFFSGWPADLEYNLQMIDKLGGIETYNHYPTGWAMAFCTPFRMFKRYTYAGGTADPLIIHWPAGITGKGELRQQYHHCTDIVPTILECCGVEMPEVVAGFQQTPLPGVSMKYSFDNADTPTRKEIQYYEMLGTRGIWHKGWKANVEHGPLPLGRGRFDEDRWQLFHVDEDRSEAHDLANEHPEKLQEMIDLWFAEAEKYNVLPLNDLSIAEFLPLEYHVPIPIDGRYTYYPNTTEVQEASAARTQNVSFKILAELDFTESSEGVIVAQGSRFGGYTMFVKDGELVYINNFLGIPPEQRISAPAPTAGRHIVGVDFKKETMGEYHEAHGTLTLYVDDDAVAAAPLRTQLGRYALTGEGLSVGYDSGDVVSTEYGPGFAFTGGTIHKVIYDVADDAYIDIEKEFGARMASD
jgi:arylsulfatase A-like enzyme